MLVTLVIHKLRHCLINRDAKPAKCVRAIAAITALLGIIACGAEPPPRTHSEPLTAYTTSYPLEFLLRRIGGERVQVVNIVSPGMDPHHYEPTPRQLAAIQGSRLFVYNGAGLEEWVGRIIEGLPAQGPLVLDTSAGLELRTVQAPGGTHKHSHGDQDRHSHSHSTDRGGQFDPHVWLDPRLYARQAERVWQALLQIETANADAEEYYSYRFETLQQELHELDNEAVAALEQCQRRVFVVPHAAFGYLAGRYNLKQIAVAGLSPEVEPSPARMRQVVREIRRNKVTHVFFESAASPAVAKVLAREVGAETLVLNPIETLTRAQLDAGEDYFSIMRSNLKNLRTALGCH